MKRTLLCAALLVATGAFAQQASQEVPKPSCEPKPVLPGARMREDSTAMRNFKRDHDKYRDCMNAYLDARKASIKAHESAANAAIEDFNATMKALNDAQKADK
jgi:hypothetical protein